MLQARKKLFCVVFRAGHECLQWRLSQTSPTKEEHLLNSCGKSDRAVCTQKKSVLPFEPFEVYSLRQPQEILCCVLDVGAVPTGTHPSLTNQPTNPRQSQRKWADLLEVDERVIQMQGLICLLVRSCGGSNFRELSGNGHTVRFCLSCSFIILTMVDDATFWDRGRMGHSLLWKGF